jgi:hypothetical protein
LETGAIAVVLNGVTPSGIELTISGPTFAMPASADGAISLSGLSGVNGMTLDASQLVLQTTPAASVSGMLSLIAMRGSSDPTLAMAGGTASPGSSMVTWALAEGGSSTIDLSQGPVVLTGFAMEG